MFPFHVFYDLIADTHSGSIPYNWQGVRRVNNDPTYGYQELVLVYNGTGSTIAANKAVMWKTEKWDEVILATAACPVVQAAGVTVSAIPTGYYGWAYRKGNVPAIADNAIAATDAPISIGSSGTDGRFDDVAVAGIEHALWGKSLSTAAAADSIRVLLCLP